MRGIDLLTLLRTDGRAMWPCDYRVGDPVLPTTKNDDFRAMLDTAKARGFVRLEYQRVAEGVSWFESKCRVWRDAVRSYLTQPLYRMPAEANP